MANFSYAPAPHMQHPGMMQPHPMYQVQQQQSMAMYGGYPANTNMMMMQGAARPEHGHPPSRPAQQQQPQHQPPQPVVPEIDHVEVAIQDALAPVAHLDTTWTLPEMTKKVWKCINKTVQKYQKDDRVGMRATSTQAQALVEEFVDNVMGACSASCGDKAWWREANFSRALYTAAQQVFKTEKLFTRAFGPEMQLFIDEGLVKYRHEERIETNFWEAAQCTGLNETHHKKAFQQLQKSYDKAHMHAPFGKSKAEVPSLRMLEDFVYGWMSDFIGNSREILQNGVGPEKENQLVFLTALFQSLVGPEMRTMPYEIFILFETQEAFPLAGWDFIETSILAISEEKKSAPPAKGCGKGGGWGKAGGWGGGNAWMMPGMFGWGW